MPVTLLLTFAPLFIGFLFGVPFAVIRRFNVPFAASFLKNESNILKGIPAVLLVLMINYLILKPIDYLALSYEWAKPLQTMNKIYIGIVCVKTFMQWCKSQKQFLALSFPWEKDSMKLRIP